MPENVELDTGFLADRSLINVSDGLCRHFREDGSGTLTVELSKEELEL